MFFFPGKMSSERRKILFGEIKRADRGRNMKLFSV